MLKYAVYDVMRCLMKDFTLRLILKGSDIALALFKKDLKFAVVASLLINLLVKSPKWFRRQGVILSIMVIEFQTQLAASLLLILKEG